MRLILVRGLPGSGKTTFCDKNYKGIFKMETDMLAMQDGSYVFDGDPLKQRHATARSLVELVLMEGADAVVSNTFTTLSELAPYIELGHKYGAAVVVFHMVGKYNDTHNVPEDVKKKMEARWEAYPGEIAFYPDFKNV